MDLYTIISAVLLLQLQGFHVALLQAPTDSPGQTIDQSWLRQLVKSKLNKTTSQAQSNDIVDMTLEGTESTDYSEWVIANGSVSFSGEQDNIQDTNETSGGVTIGTTMPPGLPNATAEEPPETTVAPEPPVSVALNSSQVSNATGEDSGFQTTTTTAITEHSNGSNSMSNYTELNETTTAPDTNSTEQIGPDPGAENRVTNSTEDFHNVTTAVPEPSSEPSTASPSTKLPLDSPGTTTAKIIPETTTTTGPSTITAMMETGAASGSNSARGLASDAVQNKKRNEAWAAILGIGVAVCFVAMVVYVILRRRDRRDFTHRKLVEEIPSDPVLRLNNPEPVDLKYDGSAYYNRGLQMENIPMDHFPQGHQN